MKFYLFSGNSDSSDFHTRLYVIKTYEVVSYCSLLRQLVKYRVNQSAFDCGGGAIEKAVWLKKKFIKLLMEANSQKELTWVDPLYEIEHLSTLVKDEKVAKRIIKSMEFEKDEGDPMVIVKACKHTASLLKFITMK